ncbi:alanyl-tRNA editing protein [Oceanirhabdus sp. W0125-5]|uniref:alanyl-tRNA editing protein n=1 Tax=Oceanirhabdus sp. W0125-5 TaxID=2999116 RepID=UPI0022F2D4BE|nr:DHHA1 domain-containing protein [Oceanirhabdus sp. W0125-5]WBW98166.1 DHHA1 domain-containing protein [Oceanirhabdus sp. W0125-5]
MTEKLYYKDSYIKECEVEIVQVLKEENKVLVVLNKTPFYPEGGGQPSDTGYINGVRVKYVFEKENIIYHEVDGELECGKALCTVDFERRFDFMQQHSGEHIVSGIIYKLFKGNNKGFHLGEDYITMDIDIYPFTDDMIDSLEEEVNNAIYKNVPFKTYIVDNEGLEKVNARKKFKVDGDIRIVEVDNIDCCPCCGTHLSRTGEIGIVKILKVEKYKGMSRLYLKCGNRAYKDYKQKHNVISELNKNFSTDEYNLLKSIDNQQQLFNNLKKQLSELKNQLAIEEASKLIKSTDNNLICKRYENKSFEEIRDIGEILSEKNYILVLASEIDKKLLFINNSDMQISCGKVFKEHIKKFNGKGGGRDSMAQGAFDTLNDLKEFYSFLCEMVKGGM